MRTTLSAACAFALCSCIGCDSSSDVNVRVPAPASAFPSAGDVADVQSTALMGLFSEDISGDVPSDRAYFAIMLLEKQTPSAEFLSRFETQKVEVVSHSEGRSRESEDRENALQAAGLYFTIQSIDWLEHKRAHVEIIVGNGWAAAIYRLDLRNDEARWSCVSIERIAIS